MAKNGKPRPPAKGLIESHGRWYLPYRKDGKQAWHSLTRVNEGDAAALAALSKLLGREVARQGNFPERMKEFKAVIIKSLALSTQPEYERILDHLAVAFERFDTEAVNPADVYDVLDQFDDAPTMARAYKARLSTFFRWCCRKRYAKANPCRDVWLEAPPKRDLKIDAAAFWKIHGAMAMSKPWKGLKSKPNPTGPIAQCLMEIFYLVEQRTTDLRLLTLSQVREGFLHFKPTKTKKTSGAKVKWPITASIQDILDRAAVIRKEHAIRSIYVFPTPEGGPYSARRFLGIWNRALGRCDMEDSGFTPKDILPSSMTDAKANGWTVEQLQTGRAHTSITTTEGYLRARQELKSEIELTLPEKPREK